jgi:hypothetical protein
MPFPHHRQHAVFAGLCHHHAFRSVAFHGANQFVRETPPIAWCVERHIVDSDALALQAFRKVPHGRKNKDDLLLVMGHVGRLLHHFHHQHDVA